VCSSDLREKERRRCSFFEEFRRFRQQTQIITGCKDSQTYPDRV
jgi:hypothetical protein